jgi:hypothetical protein
MSNEISEHVERVLKLYDITIAEYLLGCGVSDEEFYSRYDRG